MMELVVQALVAIVAAVTDKCLDAARAAGVEEAYIVAQEAHFRAHTAAARAALATKRR